MPQIHPLADVKTTRIGENTTIWQYSIVLGGALIGNNCNINSHTFIENDIIIGNNVTVKCGVYLWDGIKIEDNVFIGPNVTFTNDKYPRSKSYPSAFQNIIIKEGASIGANATILGGVTIGKFSLVGAGSIVTKNVPDFSIVYGSPAKIKGWTDFEGNKLTMNEFKEWINQRGQRFAVKNNQLIAL